MHNYIMAAGSRDRPPMLATGRYAQWQSRQPATTETPEVLEQIVVETFSNISPENKAHFDAEKEAIYLLLTEIGDEIYLTVDACKTTHDMWIAIERLQQGESLNKQDVKTSLFWEFGRFTSRDGESIESCYSMFYKMMNEMQTVDLDKESYHKLFNILKQYHKEVNEIHAEKIAKNANLLALVVAAQQYPNTYYQAPKSHKSYAQLSKQSSSTKSHASTRYKGKEIAKPITPPSESASEEDSDPEQAQRDKEMQKTWHHCKNDNQNGRFENQKTVTVAGARETCRKPKRAKDYTYHKEKILLCKQAEKGVPLQAEQADWLEDTDEEIDEEELESHYMEKVDSNVISDSSDMCDNDDHTDQNAEKREDERVMLANLIANLKLDTDENKKIQKQLKKANTSLSHELEKYKSALEQCKSSLGGYNRTRDRYFVALIDKEEHDIQEGLKVKPYEISVVKEKHDKLVKQRLLTKSSYEGLLIEKNSVIKDLKVMEGHDLDKLIAVEKQLKFLNEIVYKQNQSIQTIHMLAPKGSTYNGRPTFANSMYLKKAQSEKPCLYEIPYDKSDLTNIFAPDMEETLTIGQESR
ncbi:hypothetical protein Tco_0725743 [Tanacetum coccineum]|uniref:Gag-Pol polyprotein n=1 Tax=Tanacetum coccineum TaxID=301880 RepID=A0ABQ4YFY6_9ASTR